MSSSWWRRRCLWRRPPGKISRRSQYCNYRGQPEHSVWGQSVYCQDWLTSELLALYCLIVFSWTFPITASATRAKEIMRIPVMSKLGDTLLSARLKKIRPRHMKPAAVKSIRPYLLPCMRIPPMRTGMSLQHLKMTWRIRVSQAWDTGYRTARVDLSGVVEVAETGVGEAHGGHGGEGQQGVRPQRDLPLLLSEQHLYLRRTR